MTEVRTILTGYLRALSILGILASISLLSYIRIDFILKTGLLINDRGCDRKVRIIKLST